MWSEHVHKFAFEANVWVLVGAVECHCCWYGEGAQSVPSVEQKVAEHSNESER